MGFNADAGEQGGAGLGVDGKVLQDGLAVMMRKFAWCG